MKTLKKVALLAMLGVATTALAQPPDAQTFVKKAAQDGMMEVELGKLASEKAQSPAVKQFGGRMIKDHTKANQELTGLAKAKNLEMPAKLDAEHQSMVDMLRGKSGAEFDSSYAQHMATAHGKAIDLFEGASRLDDRDVAGFASKTLPTLKEHKKMADGLSAAAKPAAPSSSNP